MDEPRLFLIGNAHIDPAWLWRWPEGLSEVLATFRSALDRIGEHPDFVFSCGSAYFYEFVERVDPLMFEEIVSAVKEGRWEVVGGFWVEPDTNIVSGEALLRHAVMSQRYFALRFGRAPTVAFNPDAFGHSGGLPQILASTGFKAYVFMRPEPHEAQLPRAFWWRSPSGSTIAAYRIPVAYCTWPDALEKHLADVAASLRVDGALDGMCFYGVGNHGGGPTRGNLAALDARIALGHAFEYSSQHRYFERVQPEHVVEGELGYHSRGAYSANSQIKRLLRQTDAVLVGAESAASLATVLTGAAYPANDLDAAWKELLCAGFHDVAAGTTISSAAADTLDTLAGVRSRAERIAEESYISLAWNTALPGRSDETVLVVFNPNPWEDRWPVEVEVPSDGGALALVDDRGVAVPVQEVQSESLVGGRRRITFLALAPASGWSVYRLRSGDTEQPPGEPWRWQLEPDQDTGGLAGLSMDGRALLAEPSAYTTVAEDASDTWGHGLDSFQPAVNGFSGASVQLVEEGPVRRVIRSVARYGASMITQEFFEYAGWDRLLVDVTLEWMEHHKVAKLRFAAAAGGGVMTEAPYSTQCREADGREYPGGSWIACSPPGASGSDSGFTVANDAKFSYDARPGSIGITVARSPISAHHDPALPDTDHAYEWLDQGVQRFTYAICGGSDPLPAARMAAGLLRPLRVISASGHPHGHLTPGIPRLTVDGATLGAVKRSEDGTGTVVRIHNPRLAASPAQVTFGDRSFHRTLAPTAVVTVHFPDYPDEPVREVGPMEDPFSGFAGS